MSQRYVSFDVTKGCDKRTVLLSHPFVTSRRAQYKSPRKRRCPLLPEAVLQQVNRMSARIARRYGRNMAIFLPPSSTARCAI